LRDAAEDRPSLGVARPNSWDLEGLDVFKPLEVEILLQLAKGRRTVSELTEIIYGVGRQNPDYYTYYMKISRAVKALQRRGYVVSRMFGRDRPYRLTPHAAAKMIDIESVERRLVTPLDALTYMVTAALGVINIVIADSDWLDTPQTIAVYSVFLLMAGYSIRLLWNTIRRVS
jgi:hypothetical protein